MKQIFMLLYQIFSDDNGNFRKKIFGLYTFLIVFNIGAWIIAVIVFKGNTVLLGAAVLAFTFGLRHAFDVDHIASIDTVTRKLMQQNKHPTTVGFHFALGHSLALVMFVTAIAALTAWGSSSEKFSFMESYAGIASTFVSASFLLVMGVLNLTIARSTYLTFKKVRSGGSYVEEDFDVLLKRGLISRILRPLFRLVDKSWHMILIGFLFGLGFDTATEVSLLGIAGAEAAKGLSVWVILIFPALFAAGMTFMDTTDSILMVRAYGWAFRNPIRKLYYNLTITVVSATVALAIAGIEIMELMAERFHLKGLLWNQINTLSAHWELMGIVVVGIFITSWFVSTLVYRMKRYEHAETNLAVIPARESTIVSSD